jgi:hypothetical protein
VREDPKRPGLLYAGTEHDIYVSFDDGANWRSLSLNLPDTPVVDLVVEGDDLVIATHGRSFWVLDTIGAIREWNAAIASAPLHLFTSQGGVRALRAATFDFQLAKAADAGTLEIFDKDGKVLKTYRCGAPTRGRAATTMSCAAGLNRVTWDMSYPAATSFPGVIYRGASPDAGPPAPPGLYKVRLTVGADSETQPLTIHRDPRVPNVTDADLQKQFELAIQIRDRLSAANQIVIDIRHIREQIVDRQKGGPLPEAEPALTKLTAIEETIYQVKNRSPRDTLNYPIKLNDQLASLELTVSTGDYPPTDQDYVVFDELKAKLKPLQEQYAAVIRSDLKHLNETLSARGLAPITGF